MTPDDAVIILNGSHDDLARAAELLEGRGIEARIFCAEAGKS
jgi:hypothetical protein